MERNRGGVCVDPMAQFTVGAACSWMPQYNAACHRRAAPHDPRFIRARRVIFGIALASFLLSFFHRTAPAAIADELARAFAINSALLGTLAATYFYVYMVLQVPVGVLADTMGPRRLLAAGSLVAGLGSIAFALAPTWEIAAAGRTFVGVGVSVAFIAILKVSAVWFPASRFATLNGITMFAGNLGAVIAGAPLAWLVTQTSWRVVFLGLAALSIALGVASWLKVRDRPEDLGISHRCMRCRRPGEAKCTGRGRSLPCSPNPATWPGFFVNAGIAGSYLAFAGLWAVPYLEQTYAMSRVAAARAHERCSCSASPSARCWSGTLSDRLSNRRGVMRVYAVLYAGVVAAVAPARAVAAAGNARVVRPDGTPHSRLHADLGRRQGSQPARAFGHRDVDRQRRNLPRHGHPAAARGRDPRPRPRARAISACVGHRHRGARGQRRVRRG